MIMNATVVGLISKRGNELFCFTQRLTVHRTGDGLFDFHSGHPGLRAQFKGVKTDCKNNSSGFDCHLP